MAKSTKAVEVNAAIEALMAQIEQLKAQNEALTATVVTEAAKSTFVRKSFAAKSKQEYALALECGGKYNNTTYQIDFDDEKSFTKFKTQITTKRNNSKLQLKNADLSKYKWLQKSADGESFKVYAPTSKEAYKGSPLRFILSNVFLFKIALSNDGWHTLPASVFTEFFTNFGQAWIYVVGDYDPQSPKASKSDTSDF